MLCDLWCAQYVQQNDVDMLKCSDLCLAQKNGKYPMSERDYLCLSAVASIMLTRATDLTGCLTAEWVEAERLCKLYQAFPESISKDNGKNGFKGLSVQGNCQMLEATQFRGDFKRRSRSLSFRLIAIRYVREIGCGMWRYLVPLAERCTMILHTAFLVLYLLCMMDGSASPVSLHCSTPSAAEALIRLAD
jgi:hypothetical protein